MKMIRISLSLPSDMDSVLAVLAKRLGLSKSAYIRLALVKTIAEEYDYDTTNNKEDIKDVK